MQSFGDLFANNRLLAVGVVLAAIAVILAVGVALFRLVFGRRLHMSGGRTRQPRLGVVDAFDLDRQRQLVLIRRDNVEHLLMIGGPNDVLIEAAIVRAPVAIAGRDKENGFSPSVGIPAPMPQQPALPAAPLAPAPLAAATIPASGPEGGSNTPIPAAIPSEPRFGAADESTRPTPAPAIEPQPVPSAAPAPVAPQDTRLPPANSLPPAAPRPSTAAPRPVSTLPPRPPVTPVARPATGPTPRANLSRATPVVPPSSTPATDARPPGRVEPVMGRGAAEAPTTSGERPSPELPREPAAPGRFPPNPVRRPETPPVGSAGEPVRAPGIAPEPGVQDDAAGPSAPRPTTLPRPSSPLPGRTLPPRPAAAAPAPSAPATPAAPSRAQIPSMSSLEEEMAKLLGRPMPPSDPSNT